jgi:nucleotide-binding universal stress UspA family protein
MLDTVSLPKKILVGVDGSEESLAAARYAIELAGRLQAELSVLHVVMVPEYVSADVGNRLKKELVSRGESTMMRVREAAKGRDIVLREKMLTTTKSVIATFCEFASNDGSELVIMGSSGAGGVAKLMLGTVAVGVAREARCPVLLVR